MTGFSVGGLASGLDTKKIIDQLMVVEAQPQTKIGWQKSLWTARQSIWSEVNTRLNSLQTFANTLTSASTWSGLNGVSSTNISAISGALSGSGAVAGTHTVNIQQVAQAEVWDAGNTLPAATAGTRTSGVWYEGNLTPATGTTLLTNLTLSDGSPADLAAGSTITLTASKNGSPVSATFNVTGAETLDDLMTWAQSKFSGAAFTVNGGGDVTYQSGAGVPNEITALTFSAKDSLNAPIAAFNGSTGASSVLTTAAGGGAAAADTLTITQGVNVWNINIAQGDLEQQIAQKINATSGIGVSASVVSGKIKLTATGTGAANAFTTSSLGTLNTDLGLTQSTMGLDSMFDIDGTPYTRSAATNITDALTGVSLNILSTTSSAATLTVGTGTNSGDTIKSKIKDFINQYNSVIDYVNAKTSETKVASPKSLDAYLQGPLSRDYTLSNVGYQLRRWVNDTVSGLPSGAQMLSDIGITTGSFSSTYSKDNTSGKLVLDEAKLDAALAANPTNVQNIFAAAGGTTQTQGIGRRVSAMVSQWRTGGVVDSSLQGATKQIANLQSSIDKFQYRLDKKRLQYERTFAAMENAIGKMQQQSSWMSSQLGGSSS